MEKIIYVVEQLFPEVRNGSKTDLAWYEIEEYETRLEAVGRLNSLKLEGRKGFRVVEKKIKLKVVKEI